MTKKEAIHDLKAIKEFFEDSSDAYPISLEYAIDILEESRDSGDSINEVARQIHENAKAHGWWDEERHFGEIVALCHSELSEALEAYRKGEPMYWSNHGKPDGIAVEMIDCVIRIFDYLAEEEVDIEALMKMKHEYNKGRSYKHGGKKI